MGTLTRKQFRINGLPRQGVAETESIGRLLDNQLCGDQLADQLEQLVFTLSGECL